MNTRKPISMKLTNSICPLCQSTKSWQMDVHTAILNLPGNSESTVHLCENCGAYYLWPYISDALISELYSKSYFTGLSDSNSKLHVPSSNNDYESEFAAVRISKFRKTVQTLIERVPNARNILDIGAATGDFLAVAQEYGLSVSGIELSSYAAAKAKEKYGFEFHQTGIVDYQGDEKYDLIHLNHVFEHFGSPHQALERLAKLLMPGGMIYVEVPFQFNLFEVIKYRLTGRRKVFDIFSIHHPMFYRPRTLKRVFEDHGFNCNSMSVFNWSRYSAVGLKGHLKKIMWFAASFVGQGIMIEAFFGRKQ
jgi:SAM-dependent methyltransferase